MTDVSVILPTFNEAGSIRTAIAGVRTELANHDHEVIVVDDNSPDGTAETVRDVYGDDPDVTVHVRTEESGLSSAVLHGMDHADGDAYIVMDADLQHPTTAAPKLLMLLNDGADLVVGSRHAPGGRVAADWPAHRQVISKFATWMAWAAAPPARQITDPMSGLFAIRADVVEPVRSRLRPHGYKILLEFIARCPVERLDEVGYTFEEREEGDSNLGPAEYARYLVHLARLTVPSRQESSTADHVGAGEEAME